MLVFTRDAKALKSVTPAFKEQTALQGISVLLKDTVRNCLVEE